ncbi:MAG: formaldehyde-activating enzyme [Rhizobiales bacterium]|nr:formaldehyde-activating enzyme [Hyphomicrobiales bacterium]
MPRIDRLLVGEALVGDGNEVAHIDLIMGPRGSSAEIAFVNALTNNKDGFTGLLAVVEPNLMVKPATVLFNKVTIKDARQAVADCVADGTIPVEEADDIFICVGVFIHWDASDDARIQAFNHEATRLAISRAIGGTPSPVEAMTRRETARHPLAVD